MYKFKKRLASFLDDKYLRIVANEIKKPQSLRAVARKLQISVYAVKRLSEYYNSQNKNSN